MYMSSMLRLTPKLVVANHLQCKCLKLVRISSLHLVIPGGIHPVG